MEAHDLAEVVGQDYKQSTETEIGYNEFERKHKIVRSALVLATADGPAIITVMTKQKRTTMAEMPFGIESAMRNKH